MKIRNKKTGEIVDAESCNNTGGCISIYYEEKDGQIGTKDCFTSLAELNEDWEDAPEEPKEYCYITGRGNFLFIEDIDGEDDKERKQIGNYFETREEAEKAVEKLKAWKRLKDKGFKFEGWYGGNRIMHFRITSLDEDGDCLPHFVDDDTANDLDLLFGGEE